MNDKSSGRTFLKSTQHVKILEQPQRSWRSVLVGVQCGILLLPYEIIAVVLWPLIRNLAVDIYQTSHILLLVFISTVEAINFGFMGYLEASDEHLS